MMMTMRYRLTLMLGTLLLAGCATADEETPAEGGTAAEVESAQPAAATLTCTPQGDRMDLAGRVSPYDSTAVPLGDAQAKVCYGRPSMRGRTVFGDMIPFGELWRTGANEPTIIHLPVAANIAGIAVEPGSYSLYTIPGEEEWTLIVNRSISQWGIESQYTSDIEAQEVGRATLPAETTGSPVETFTISATPSGNGSELVMEWENARVRVPVTP